MAPHGRRKRSESAALVAALARGLTYADASRETGIPERTIRRRMADPAFAAEVRAGRGVLVDRLAGKYAAEGDRTLEALIRLRDSAESEAVKLGALRTINEYLVRLREHAELAKEIADLRALIEGPKAGA